jgi:hypothetical protein
MCRAVDVERRSLRELGADQACTCEPTGIVITVRTVELTAKDEARVHAHQDRERPDRIRQWATLHLGDQEELAASACPDEPAAVPGAAAQRGSVDLLGAAAATGGLAVTVLGIVRAPDEAWGSATTLLVLAGGMALLAAFVAIQAARRDR